MITIHYDTSTLPNGFELGKLPAVSPGVTTAKQYYNKSESKQQINYDRRTIS